MTHPRVFYLIVIGFLVAAAAYVMPMYAKTQNIVITTYGSSAAVTMVTQLPKSGSGTGFFNDTKNSFTFGFVTYPGGCAFELNIDNLSHHKKEFEMPCINVTIEDVLAAFPHLPEALRDALRIALEIVARTGG